MIIRGRGKGVPAPVHVCRDCAWVTYVTKFSTLSLEGRPTLGRCPYYGEGRYSVLLSQKGCDYFRDREKDADK